MSARDELAKLLFQQNVSNAAAPTAPEIIMLCEDAADAILAAGYRKAEPSWAETLVNDGTYEYTISSDCDGSNVTHWRRIPGLTYEGQASPWVAYEPEPSSE